MIEVTQDAINQMNHILEKNGDAAVRYELKAGGCGGIIAEWGTEPHHEPEQGERTWPLANGLFVMDEFTKDFIDGGVVNYDLSNFMPNFIVSVPGKGQCGCGSSFVIGRSTGLVVEGWWKNTQNLLKRSIWLYESLEAQGFINIQVSV